MTKYETGLYQTGTIQNSKEIVASYIRASTAKGLQNTPSFPCSTIEDGTSTNISTDNSSDPKRDRIQSERNLGHMRNTKRMRVPDILDKLLSRRKLMEARRKCITLPAGYQELLSVAPRED